MEELKMFKTSTENPEQKPSELPSPPNVPLSPMKKASDVENILDQWDDSESKIIALAQIMKKDRKKNKTLKLALAQEITKNDKIYGNIENLTEQIDVLRMEVKEKDARIVKTYGDYMSTYEALLKLRNQKEVGIPKVEKKPK
jgi:seryl-tRNA synthetase